MRHETQYGYGGRLMMAQLSLKGGNFVEGGSLPAHNRHLDRQEVAAAEARHLAVGRVHASRVDVARADEGSVG